MLKTYWKYENAMDVIREWPAHFDTPPPRRQTIYDLRDKFERTGGIMDAPRSGRPVTVTTQENTNLVAQFLVENPRSSTRVAAATLNIERRSIRRMIHDAGFRPYIPRLIHGLLGDDSDRRLQFCELFINEVTETPDIQDHIVWSDEALFKLSGHVNRHNSVYYDTTNPHKTMEQQINQPGLCVWGGISSSGVIGPFIFQGTLDGEKYLRLLRTNVMPILKQRPDFNRVLLQQDGAPPHFASAVRTFLDEALPSGWIGRRGRVDWPARSPDLTPMDFFFWGILKDFVYHEQPRTLVEMRARIHEGFERINANTELCQKVCRSVVNRCHFCVEQNGEQFEHLYDSL